MSRASETYYRPPRADSLEGRLRGAAIWGALGLAWVLIAASVNDYRYAVGFSEELAAGEHRSLEIALSQAIPPGESPPDAERLDEVLAQLEEVGLRYIAVRDPDGEDLVSAGSPATEAELNDQTRRRGALGPPERRRGAAPGMGPPPRGEGGPPDGLPPDGPPPDGPPPDGPPPGLGLGPPGQGPIVYEFEPRWARGLRRRTLLSLGLSLSVAGAMLFGAFTLRRLTLKASSLSVKLERERHLAALGEMSAVLAHELRNPIASLKGNAQLLVEVLEAPKLKARGEWLVSEATRMEALTNDLLDFARSGMVDRQSVDPRAVIDEVVRELEPERVLIDAPQLPHWPLDPMRLHQALSNLARNALQAASEPPPELSARVEGQELVFVVRDHGAGLPSGFPAEELFQAFRTTRTRGTGLGLAVVRRVADLHGGHVTADDHPEGGARFTLRIPKDP